MFTKLCLGIDMFGHSSNKHVIRSYGHFDWGQLIWNNLNLIQMFLVIANNPFVFWVWR